MDLDIAELLGKVQNSVNKPFKFVAECLYKEKPY